LLLEVSISIDRPVATVWDSYAVHHVENLPAETRTWSWKGNYANQRRDRDQRRSTRFETPTEGTMEIIEFEPEKLMRVETHDGGMTIDGWARFADLRHEVMVSP